MPNNPVWSPAGACPSAIAGNVVSPDLTAIQTAIGDILTEQSKQEQTIDTHETNLNQINVDLANLKQALTNIQTSAGTGGTGTGGVSQAELDALKQALTNLTTRLDGSDKLNSDTFDSTHQALADVSTLLQGMISDNTKSININRNAINNLTTVSEQNKNVTIDAVSKLDAEVKALINQLGSKVDLVDAHEIKITDVESKLKLTSDHVNDLNTHITDLTQLNNDAISKVIANVDAMGTNIASSLQAYDAKLQATEDQIKQLPTKDDVKTSVDNIDSMYGDALRGIVPAVEKLKEQANQVVDRCTAAETEVTNLTTRFNNLSNVGKDGRDGVDGRDGIDGKDAIQYYTHIQFSNYQDGKTSLGQTVFGTAGAEYMGVITNSTEKDAPKDADSYTWVRTRGMDGVEGAKGDAGRDSPEKYMHIVFSDFNNGVGVDGNASFKDIGAYLGIIVNSLSKDQPTDPKEYKWLRVLGKSGADGADGSSENIHVAYSKFEDGIDPSDNKSKIFTSYPADDDDRKYFGIAIVNSRRAPDKAQSYRWAKFGAEPKYTHFVYSKFSNGKNSNGVPELITKYAPDNEKVYIGILNNSDYATAPTDPDVYTWHKTGISQPAYQMRIIYSKYVNGKNPQGWADFTLDPKGDPSYKYIGIRQNVPESEPPGASQDSIGKFAFSRLTTEKGDKGDKGDKGAASVLSLRYSSTSDGKKSDGSSNFSYMSKDTDRYVGFYIGEESYTGTNADDLQWVRLTGEKGDTGDTGKSLKTYIKFSDYQYGLDDAGLSQLSDDATGKKFIGFQLNSQFDVASSDAKDYLWYSLGKGEKGDDGQSLYTHVVYSKYSNGVDTKKNQVSFSTTSSRDTEYVGIRPNQKSETINNTSDPTTYQWFKVKGKIDLTPIRTSITNLETEVANLKANPSTGAPVDLKPVTDKLDVVETRVTALEAKPEPVPVDLQPLETRVAVLEAKPDPAPIDLTPIETRVTAVETDIAALKANPVVPVNPNPDPNQPMDLTQITDTVNKFTADVTTLGLTVSDHTNRLATLGTASTANGTLSKENATKITVLQDADRAIGGRIDNVVASITAVNNRVNNLVVNAGNVAQGEIQTVKDSLKDLETRHKKELDRLQNKKASYTTVDQIRVEIGEVKGEMGDIKKNNQETTDKMNRYEQEHHRFIKKDAVTAITDPLKTDVDALKPKVDTIETDLKKVNSDIYDADKLAKDNKDKLDKLIAKVDGLETKIQTLSDDLTQVQTIKGVTVNDLSDLEAKLIKLINNVSLDDSVIENKVNSFVDKKLGITSLTSQGIIKDLENEVAQLKQAITDVECNRLVVKYSPHPDGSDYTSIREHTSTHVGFKIEKC